MEDASIKLPAELFAPAESSRFEGVLNLQQLQAGPDVYQFETPVSWSVDVTNTGDAFLVMGKAEGSAYTQCARCLDDIVYDLEGDIQGYFLVSDEAMAPDDMEGDEFDVLPESHIIDLVPLIQAALLVELPQLPLCSDDCKGLCPECGANLNDGPCGCTNRQLQDFEEAKNPFSVLKGYSFEEENTE